MSADVAAAHAAVREWRRGAKEQPSHGGHIIVRYMSKGLLTGTLRPIWRCSCDPVNQYAIYEDGSTGKPAGWFGGTACSPEAHIQQHAGATQ